MARLSCRCGEARMRAKNKPKGIVNVIELILVVVTLFVSFTIFFPGNIYRNKWDDAYGTLRARDAMLALERSGHLHEYAFSPSQDRKSVV